jgi:hypothetical protein
MPIIVILLLIILLAILFPNVAKITIGLFFALILIGGIALFGLH